MKHLKAKWNSKRGASLLVALLFFTVAMVVGLVVLTGATADAGRLEDAQQEEQSYLNVSSAAMLLRDNLVGASFSYVETTTAIGTNPATSEDPVSICTSPVLESELKELAEQVVQNLPATPGEWTLYATGFDEITIQYKMDMNYDLTLVVFESDDQKNPITIFLPADCSLTGPEVTKETQSYVDGGGETVQYEVTTTVTTTEVKWLSATVTKGGVVS